VTTAFVHEFPGPAVRFRRAIPVDHHRDVLTVIDEAFAALRPLFRPLVVEVAQVVMDVHLGLPDPEVVLDAARVAVVLEMPVTPVTVDLTRVVVIRAEGRPLSVCIAERHDAPDGYVVVAANGRVVASEAKLPSFGGDTLPLETRTGPVSVPVHRDDEGVWVAGPLPETPTQPPIGMRWSYEGGILDLDVVMAWSSWSEEPPGAYLVQQATAALVASGWARNESAAIDTQHT
jgi:hypothetical protein